MRLTVKSFVNLKRIHKTVGIIAAFLLLGASPAMGHDGKTPFTVLKDMKRKKTGPYASPFIMGNNTLVKDWLGIRTEDVFSPQPGVLIVEVKEIGVAGEEGLEKGDVIIGINTAQIRNQDDLEKFLEGIENPDVFTFRLIRDNDQEDEDVYLDNNLAEMDGEMTDLIMSKRKNGEFKKGMLREDLMARSPLGSMDGQEGATINPRNMMKQMMARTPMGKRGVFPKNMKNVNLSVNRPGSGFPVARSSRTRTFSPPFAGTKVDRIDRTEPDFLFHKADYQVAIDRKIKFIKHPEILKELTLGADQKGKTATLGRTTQKYLIKQDALLAMTRLDLEDALENLSTDRTASESLVKNYQHLQEEKYIRLIRFIVEFEQIIDQKQKERFRSLTQLE